MTQPSASDTSPQQAPATAAVSGDQASTSTSAQKITVKATQATDDSKNKKDTTALPLLRHPNFDPDRTPIDPARPLSDIPEPAARIEVGAKLKTNSNRLPPRSLAGNAGLLTIHSAKKPAKAVPERSNFSKWELVESVALADHLALLSAAQLIDLPPVFYKPQSEPALLTPLYQMSLVDMGDISAAIQAYPKLNRYGIQQDTHRATQQHRYTSTRHTAAIKPSPSLADQQAANVAPYGFDADELLNSDYADDWEVILYPERFDAGLGNLNTEVMACSVAVHALKQCDTRKSINNRYSASDICHYLRSYLLSQITLSPSKRQQLRQIHLYPGHVIVAAHYLGWQMQQSDNGECYFNISSRSALLARYVNFSDYYINGWSSQLG